MSDYLLRILDKEQKVRVFLANTTGVVETARLAHETAPTASAALGRVLTAALIMASDFKNDEDQLTIRIDGGGPAGTIIATADATGRVRGFITNPAADIPAKTPGKLAVGDMVGTEGFIEVIKDLGLKEPFSGRTDLVSGEIAEDLANYYYYSEQIPSLVSLGVLVSKDISIQAAGGLLVQAMPGASDQVLEALEYNILSAGNISTLIDTYDSLEEIAEVLMQGVPYDIVGRLDLTFQCNCERTRMLSILASLSVEDLDSLKDEEQIEIVCHFCNSRYYFTYDEIVASKNKSPG